MGRSARDAHRLAGDRSPRWVSPPSPCANSQTPPSLPSSGCSSSRRSVPLHGARCLLSARRARSWHSVSLVALGHRRERGHAPLLLVRETTAIVRNFSLLGLGLAPIVLATGGLRRWSAVRRDPDYSSRPPLGHGRTDHAWTLFAVVGGKNHSYVRDSAIGSVTFNGVTSGPVVGLFLLVALTSAVAGGAFVAVVAADLASGLHRTPCAAPSAAGSTVRTTRCLSCSPSPRSRSPVRAVPEQEAIFERYLFPGFVGVVVLLCSAAPVRSRADETGRRFRESIAATGRVAAGHGGDSRRH